MPATGITLRCEECKMENYITKKNKKNTVEKIELKKHCHKCNKHTSHKEKKQMNSKELSKVFSKFKVDALISEAPQTRQ